MAKVSAFRETKLMFCSAIQYEHPLTFDEWNLIPQEYKAAHLFVQFYDNILQAWHKANRLDMVHGEDGVSTVLQYLMKNVPTIEANPSRFQPQYIYQVAYNCIYCLCEPERTIFAFENEVPNIYEYDGEELNLYDTVVDTNADVGDVYDAAIFGEKFWSAIEGDVEAAKILNYLMTKDPKDLKKVTKRNRLYNIDPLRDVEVSLDKVPEIVERIKSRLERIDGLKEYYNIG